MTAYNKAIEFLLIWFLPLTWASTINDESCSNLQPSILYFGVFLLTLRYIFEKPVWEKEGLSLPSSSPKCEWRPSCNYLPVARRGCISFLMPWQMQALHDRMHHAAVARIPFIISSTSASLHIYINICECTLWKTFCWSIYNLDTQDMHLRLCHLYVMMLTCCDLCYMLSWIAWFCSCVKSTCFCLKFDAFLIHWNWSKVVFIRTG